PGAQSRGPARHRGAAPLGSDPRAGQHLFRIPGGRRDAHPASPGHPENATRPRSLSTPRRRHIAAFRVDRRRALAQGALQAWRGIAGTPHKRLSAGLFVALARGPVPGLRPYKAWRSIRWSATVANTDKKTADKAATSNMPAGKTSSAPPPDEHSLRPVWLAIIGVLAAAAVAAGIIYYRGGFDRAGPGGPEKEPGVGGVMAPGPVEDIVLGKPDAPVTI